MAGSASIGNGLLLNTLEDCNKKGERRAGEDPHHYYHQNRSHLAGWHQGAPVGSGQISLAATAARIMDVKCNEMCRKCSRHLAESYQMEQRW